MRDRFVLFTGLGLAALLAAQAPALAAAKTADNPNGCQIIKRHDHSAADNSGSISSSVTAGNGRVSGMSSAGGTGVTVHSGNGSSVATSTTSGGGATTAMVTNSDGSCTIYVDPGDHKESQK